jgi:hypothetical protein
MPIKKQPEILTRKVPSGNTSGTCLPMKKEIPYLSILPSPPPIPTKRKDFSNY